MRVSLSSSKLPLAAPRALRRTSDRHRIGADIQFGGHGLIPTLVRDMQNPKQADLVTDLVYVIAMAFHLAVGMAGYMMYGRDVSDEVCSPKLEQRLAVEADVTDQSRFGTYSRWVRNDEASGRVDGGDHTAYQDSTCFATGMSFHSIRYRL